MNYVKIVHKFGLQKLFSPLIIALDFIFAKPFADAFNVKRHCKAGLFRPYWIGSVSRYDPNSLSSTRRFLYTNVNTTHVLLMTSFFYSPGSFFLQRAKNEIATLLHRHEKGPKSSGCYKNQITIKNCNDVIKLRGYRYLT